MKEYELVVIGAGPAGLCAAIEAAEAGTKVLLIDENKLPGGQLFKQIHKFFGSREHNAGIRGIRIGEQLLQKAEELKIEICLSTEVMGIQPGNSIWVVKNQTESFCISAKKMIVATGATENSVSFPGWDMPGVMGAGAAQTMVNVNRILPGERFVILGSGNVGVIVAYQIMQAGGEVVAILEAAPAIGGYGVHTAKVARQGVPFYTSRTIKRVYGTGRIEHVETILLDKAFKQIEGTELTFDADTVCLATGLTPLTELALLVGCKHCYIGPLGGLIPIHDYHMRTTCSDVFVAGDVAGIEEASTAMDEGRLAGIAAAHALGYVSEQRLIERTEQLWGSLNALRTGSFGQRRRTAKDLLLSKGEQ